MNSLSQYINEKLMSIDDMIKDYNVISDSPDTITKKNIASKYGLVSKKSDDIKKAILVAIRNERNKRRKYSDDDIIWFKRFGIAFLVLFLSVILSLASSRFFIKLVYSFIEHLNDKYILIEEGYISF